MNALWNVSTDTFINEKESIMRNGNVYQIANGYMSYRGTLDEFGPEELVGITLAGLQRLLLTAGKFLHCRPR
jgi:kojibiose phosphorylase